MKIDKATRVSSCPRCGFEDDRDVVASLNLHAVVSTWMECGARPAYLSETWAPKYERMCDPPGWHNTSAVAAASATVLVGRT